MQCPRCKSENVTVNREYDATTQQYKTVAVCKNCGNAFNPNEKVELVAELYALAFVVIILLVLGFGSGIFQKMYKAHKENENRKAAEATEETTPENYDPTVITTDKEVTSNVWNSEYTSIEDFDWDVDEYGIVLGDYKVYKDKCKIRLSDRYTINGEDYHIYYLEGCFFCANIKSVIVPEGVTKIKHNTFNSSKIEYLYLPSTLEEFDGWYYMDSNLKALYYGGSEEEFKEKFDLKGHIPDATIEYNVNPDDLK